MSTKPSQDIYTKEKTLDELAELFKHLADMDEDCKYKKMPATIWQHLKLYNGFEKILETEMDEVTKEYIAELAHKKIDWKLLKRAQAKMVELEPMYIEELENSIVSFYPKKATVSDTSLGGGNGNNYIGTLRIHVYYEEG